jgi:heme oxygenase
MFTDTIKIATLENHQQVEKLLVGKMKNIRSTEDYVELLKMFYSYFSGLEQIIKPFISGDHLSDYEQRRKSEAIAYDIKILGGSVSAFANTDQLPIINNNLQAFGALYVMEGSTLGGKIIAGVLQKHLKFNDDEGLSFFTGYGENSMQMWETFKQALNTIVKSDEDEVEVVYAANETFIKFKQWLEK